jgi:hypothetical protein
MTKPAASIPQLPELKLPKLDLDALFASHKANLAALHEAQNAWVEAAQAIAKVQYGWTQEAVAGAEAALRAKEPKKPEVVLADFVAATEKAVKVTKETADLAVAAQRHVAEQFARRFAANLEEIKALAA